MRRRSARLFALILVFALFLSAAPRVFAQDVKLTVSHTTGGTTAPDQSDLIWESGKPFHIQANADSGYRFDYWELVNTKPGKVEFDESKPEQDIILWDNAVLKAHFVPDVYDVKVRWEGREGGTLNFREESFAPGEEVTVSVIPYEGYSFTKWTSEELSLGEDATDPTLTFIMPSQDVVIYAHAAANTYHFKLISGGGGRADVEGKKPNETGEYECQFGEEIELYATPYGLNLFSTWSGTNDVEILSPDTESTTIICPASDFTVRAQFASTIRNLNIVSTEGGSVSPQEGSVRLGGGNYIELLAVPEEGFAFSRWECSSGEGDFTDPKNPSVTFTMPDVNCTVTAVFVKAGYRLTLTSTVGGRVDESAQGNYELGEQVPVVAIPEEGYEFVRWECADEGVVWDETALETVVTMPGKDVRVNAVFALKGGAAAPVTTTSEPGKKEGSPFPWGILVVLLILSGVVITLIVVRERYNLSFGYLVKRWFRDRFGKERTEAVETENNSEPAQEENKTGPDEDKD